MTENNDKIVALTDREKAREKLPIFYGSRDNFTHGFREVLNNGVDEILNHFDNGIVEIILHDDLETITVKDSGRGIPIQEVNENGKPYYDLIFSTLFASGKYEANDKTNSGVNGVGTAVLNATSDIFNVEVCNNGYKYIIEYENGGYIKVPLTKLEKTTDHYTKITFKLDKTMYTETKYEYENIRNIIDKTSKVSPNITLKLFYNNNEEIFHFDSLEDYFINHSSDNLVESFAGINKTYDEINGEKTQIKVVLSCADNEDSLLQECMLNGNNLIEKSSIYDGIITGAKFFINKYIKDNGLYEKKEKNISYDDVNNVLSFCCNVLSNRVEFQSQTKFSTAKKLYQDVAYEYIKNVLEIYSIERKNDFVKLVNQVLLCKRANEKAESTRKEIKKMLEEKITNASNRPLKFVPCRSKNPNEINFVVIEGDSSLNSIKLGRNSYNTCILPLKGKPINPFKSKLDKLLNNDEVKAIFKVLGCGMEYKGKSIKGVPKFNIENLQIDKLLIATDFDIDGYHIQCLFIAIIYTLAPQLLKAGKVYILYTPLYVIKIKTEIEYNGEKSKELLAYSETERNEIVKMLNDKTISFKETRFKGLGGLSVPIMAKALSEDKRIIKQITMEDAEKTKELLELFLTDERLADRKEFIETKGKEYFDYSLYE